MIKFFSVLILILTAVTFSACGNFSGTDTSTVAESNPKDVIVYVKLDEGAKPDVLQNLIASLNSIPQVGDVTISDPKFLADSAMSELDMHSLQITLGNIPDQKITIENELFFRTRTYNIFNPISLLPEVTELTYYYAIPSDRNHSSVNTDMIEQSSGQYVYFWSTGEEIVFTDVYANRPIYYAITILATIIIGLIVYFVCKKRAKPL